MNRYVTACRRWQLPVLLQSMRRHCRPFFLHVLAWDWERGEIADDGNDWFLVNRRMFTDRNPRWAEMPGPERSVIDQVATARWRFAADVMRDTNDPVTIIDGDLWFWSSPAPAFEEIPRGAAIAATPHRFLPAAAGRPGVTEESHGVFGRFNTGWTFLRSWMAAEELAERNLAWSYSFAPGSRVPIFGAAPDLRGRMRRLFGDQGHLEMVVDELGPVSAHVIQHPGVNAAPWNVHGYDLSEQDGTVWVTDAHKLIAYHYSSMKFGADGEVTQWADHGYRLNALVISTLYQRYAQACADAIRGRL